jgi:hypothetical protein
MSKAEFTPDQIRKALLAGVDRVKTGPGNSAEEDLKHAELASSLYLHHVITDAADVYQRYEILVSLGPIGQRLADEIARHYKEVTLKEASIPSEKKSVPVNLRGYTSHS